MATGKRKKVLNPENRGNSRPLNGLNSKLEPPIKRPVKASKKKSLDPQILAQFLVEWYRQNRRDLPWRANQDPYRIWISEVMLQQTTVTAVIPFFERFTKKLPTLQSLAEAPLETVYELWAGLGYYSRARNLHAASRRLHTEGFPKTYQELIEFPGFGPYTSRAVASIAFQQNVGVLDGNVIRILSRVLGKPFEWWKTKDRSELQKFSDQMNSLGDSREINQALMELGAMVCSPQKPQCLFCPWMKVCKARLEEKISELPLQKPRKKSQVWIWKPQIFRRGSKVGLIKNDYAPFLKNQWIFPGSVETTSRKPKEFDLKHFITHHDIYVRVTKSSKQGKAKWPIQWIKEDEIPKWNPSSVLQKILKSHA